MGGFEVILGFKERFVPAIRGLSKIHSIREDKHKRWKAEMVIHFATGVRTKNYDCFLIGKCQSVQEINIDFYRCNENDHVVIDRMILSQKEKETLAKNDGFKDYFEFRSWFIKMNKYDWFNGRIIHWTNKIY